MYMTCSKCGAKGVNRRTCSRNQHGGSGTNIYGYEIKVYSQAGYVDLIEVLNQEDRDGLEEIITQRIQQNDLCGITEIDMNWNTDTAIVSAAIGNSRQDILQCINGLIISDGEEYVLQLK
jgi:hypothetical protein